MNAFVKWWQAATPQEREALAEHCRTTPESLRQEAFAYRSGGVLKISLGRAVYVESGTRKLQRDGLPVLTKEELCPMWVEVNELLQTLQKTS